MAKRFLFSILCLLFFPLTNLEKKKFDEGKILFFTNCLPCHTEGTNIILPEKNLKKESLETNGMNNFKAITYQILNGKNGMPAFGGRLSENEIETVAFYVLQESEIDFQEN